jgi:hypothetical protein
MADGSAISSATAALVSRAVSEFAALRFDQENLCKCDNAGMKIKICGSQQERRFRGGIWPTTPDGRLDRSSVSPHMQATGSGTSMRKVSNCRCMRMQSSTVRDARASLTNSCSHCSEQKTSGHSALEYRGFRSRWHLEHCPGIRSLGSTPPSAMPHSTSSASADLSDWFPGHQVGALAIFELKGSCLD